MANRNFKYEYKDVVGSDSFPAGHTTRERRAGTLVESDGTTYTIKVPFGCYKRSEAG